MGPTGLEVWYRKVRSVAVGTLDASDVARALRQELHVPLVGLRAIELLGEDALVGEQYPGEMIAALAALPAAKLRALDGAALAALRQVLADVIARERPDASDDSVWAEVIGDARSLQALLASDRSTAAKPLVVRAVISGEAPQSAPLVEQLSVGSAIDASLQFRNVDAGLARKHVILVPKDDGRGAYVEVLGHAAKLNGKDVAMRCELNEGDVLEIGSVRVTLERDS